MPRFLRSGALVSVAAGAEIGAQALRAVILARLLGPDEFGLAVMASLLSGIVEVVSMGGAERFITFARHGGSRRTLACMHTIWLLRGFVAAGLLLLLAGPFAWMIGRPDAQATFSWLAFAPLLRSAAHLGVVRCQRAGAYRPDAVAALAGSICALAGAALGGWVMADHRAMILSILMQAMAYAVVTHIAARRTAWRLAWHWPTILEALRFGLPLTANGLALQALGQLDRVIVGALLGPRVLATYSPALMILLLPTTLASKIAMPWLQPRLSAAWRQPGHGDFAQQLRIIDRGLALLALLGGIVAAGFGDLVLGLVFGPAYLVGAAVFGLFSVGFVFRMGRVSLNVAGLAIGQTMWLVRANMTAAVTLPVTALALMAWPHMGIAAAGFMLAEATGFLATARLLRRDRATATLRPEAPWFGAAAAVLLWGGALAVLDPGIAWRIGAALAAGVLVATVARRMAPASRAANGQAPMDGTETTERPSGWPLRRKNPA